MINEYDMSGVLRKILNYYKLMSIHFSFNEVIDLLLRCSTSVRERKTEEKESNGSDPSIVKK